MNNKEKAKVTKVIKEILSTSNGIPQKAYNQILELANVMEYEPLNEILRHVDATDGEFYLPEDY